VKLPAHLISDDPKTLTENYGCDLILKKHNLLYILNEILDGEYQEIKS